MKTFKLNNDLFTNSSSYEGYISHQSSHAANSHRSERRYSTPHICAGLTKGILSAFGEIESILAIGTRGRAEINFLKEFTAEVTGIDLFVSPLCEEIVKCDMHCVDEMFEENAFDIVYSCHSLEHAANPVKLLANIKKVGRRGAFFVVPPTSLHDTGPTKGHPFWIWCLNPHRYSVANLQNFIDELMGKDFATVKECAIIDDSNYGFALEWEKTYK